MADPDFDALARAHMVRQVREVAAVQVALARLWDRMIDPSDLDASFRRFREAAIPLIQAGGIRGEATAQRYFDAVRVSAGLPPSPVDVERSVRPPEAIRQSLAASTKLGYATFLVGQGADPTPILAAARAAMLRSAKRQALQAGRTRLIRLSERDPDVRGWARVSDGSPCPFCALLVGRGPVYSANTGGFRAHDGCGCSVRVVLRRDPTGGWSPDARAYAKVYADGPDLSAFRANLADARAAGDLADVETARVDSTPASANPTPTPTSPRAGGGEIDRIEAAAVMYGRGSPQYLAAVRRFG